MQDRQREGFTLQYFVCSNDIKKDTGEACTTDLEGSDSRNDSEATADQTFFLVHSNCP